MRIQGKVLSDENLIYQKRIYQTRYTVHYHMRKIVQNQIWQTLGRSPVNVLSRTDTLLKALSSQAIKTSKDGDCTTSLDNPSNTWLFHAGKVFSWFQSETFLHQFTIIVSDSIFSKNLPACSSRQLSGPCEMTSPPCWMSPIPLAPARRAGAPALIILVASTELTPDYQCLPHAQARRTPLDVALQMQMNHFMDLLAMFQSTDVHTIPHSFSIYSLLAVFILNTVSLPLTCYLPTALLNAPGNPSTVGKSVGILCPEKGKELFAPFSFICIH